MAEECHFCGRSGHWKASCLVGITCFHGRRPDHRARLCPSQRNSKLGIRKRRRGVDGGVCEAFDGRRESTVLRVCLLNEMVKGLVCVHLEVGNKNTNGIAAAVTSAARVEGRKVGEWVHCHDGLVIAEGREEGEGLGTPSKRLA